MPVTLTVPKARVTYRDQATGDLTELTIQTTNRDLVAFDLIRERKHWPEFQSAPFLGASFLAWSALQRDPACPPELKLAQPEQFMDVVLEVEVIKDSETPVDPTQAGRHSLSGSLSPSSPAATPGTGSTPPIAS